MGVKLCKVENCGKKSFCEKLLHKTLQANV